MTDKELIRATWQYILNLGIIIDEDTNAILFLGDPHETISARVGKLAATGNPSGLFLQQAINEIMHNPKHCQTEARKEASMGYDAIIPDPKVKP